MTLTQISKTDKDYQIGRGSYISAVNLYNLLLSLIDNDSLFIKQEDERRSPKENSEEKFELTETAKIAYSMLLHQFYILDLNSSSQTVTSTSLNSVKENMSIICPLLKLNI